MSKTEVTKVKAIVPKVRNYKVTLSGLKDLAIALQHEVEQIAAAIAATRQNLLIPFLFDLCMGVRTGIVNDARTFLLNCGFRSEDSMNLEDKASHPMTLETCLGYQKKVATWMNGGTLKSKMPTSMTAIQQGASKVKQNVTAKGTPSADFLKAASGSSAKFRKDIADGKWGTKGAQAGNRSGTGTTKPKETGGKNSVSDSAIPSNTGVALWIQAQVNVDELIRFRNDVSKRIAKVRKDTKKKVA